MTSQLHSNTVNALQMLLWWITLALIALASVVPSSQGAAFAVLTITGLFSIVACQHPYQAPTWLRYWLWACLGSLALRAVAVFYWQDPWDERHAELKLLLGAVSAVGIWKCLPPNRTHMIQLLSNAISMALVLALFWVWKEGRGNLVTHPVPWAHVMSFMVCWLLAVSIDKRYASEIRLLWVMGSIAGLLAVLVSQSRGSYVILPWWIAIMAWKSRAAFLTKKSNPSDKNFFLLVIALVLATAMVAVLLPSVRQTLHDRVIGHLQTAASEAVQSSESSVAGSNSSVGARLYMWQRSFPAVAHSPWVGYGQAGRLQLIRSWAQEADSTEVRRLGHVHNEYLHALLDHGLWGLSSLLLSMVSLIVLVRILYRQGQTTPALALFGILVIYITGEITSVSYAHNFFTAGLATMLTLTLAVLPCPPMLSSDNGEICSAMSEQGN